MVAVLPRPQERHPAVFELVTLLAAVEEVNSRLQAQAEVQQDMLAALVKLIQNEFSKTFRQVFASHLTVLWPNFTPLIRTLTI